MNFIKYWSALLLPIKLYGGGGSQIVSQDNPQAEALANVSQQKWKAYQDKYVPVENQWMNNIEQLNNPSYHQQAEGMASAGVKDQNGPQTANVGESMTGQRLGQGNYLDEAKQVAGAAADANSGATNRALSGQQSVVDIGNGQSSQVTQGLSDVAKQSVEGQVQNAKNQNTLYQSGLSTVGTAAGGLAAGALHYSDNSK